MQRPLASTGSWSLQRTMLQGGMEGVDVGLREAVAVRAARQHQRDQVQQLPLDGPQQLRQRLHDLLQGSAGCLR